MASKWSVFVERWKDCTACGLCEHRQKVVLARGSVPCDILFIGEAPGESEDCLGQPFVGPAGQLLDRIVRLALPYRSHEFDSSRTCDYCGVTSESVLGATQKGGVRCPVRDLRTAYTNLVCCIPRDEDGLGKATEPDDDSVKACSVRLVEFVELCNPKLLVCVGKLAKDWLDPGWKHSLKLHRKIPTVDIIHPAAVLRANVAQQGLLTQRAVIALRNGVESVFQ